MQRVLRVTAGKRMRVWIWLEKPLDEIEPEPQLPSGYEFAPLNPDFDSVGDVSQVTIRRRQERGNACRVIRHRGKVVFWQWYIFTGKGEKKDLGVLTGAPKKTLLQESAVFFWDAYCDEDHRGNGLNRYCKTRIMRELREREDVRTATTIISPFNEPNARSLEKMGFRSTSTIVRRAPKKAGV